MLLIFKTQTLLIKWNITTENIIKSPPIFIKGVQDFITLCTSLIKMLGVENVICKCSSDRLKIQTSNSNTLPLARKRGVSFISTPAKQANSCSDQKSTPINSHQSNQIRTKTF
jgi:hypothetical protein